MSDMMDERLDALEQVATLHTEAVTRATALIGELTATHAALGAVLAGIALTLGPDDRASARAVARRAVANAGGSEAVLALVDGLTGTPADAGAVLLDLPGRLQ